MAIAINRVTNANIYVNGVNFLGRAEEVSLPDVKFKMSEHKAIGMVGSAEFTSGVEKLEAKIKWNSFYADAIVATGNPFATVQLQVRANVESYGSTGRTAQVPLVTFMTVQPKNFPTGNFKQHDNVELETNFSVYSVKQIINGVTTMEYDVLANIFRLNGVDLLATYRQNTGA